MSREAGWRSRVSRNVRTSRRGHWFAGYRCWIIRVCRSDSGDGEDDDGGMLLPTALDQCRSLSSTSH